MRRIFFGNIYNKKIIGVAYFLVFQVIIQNFWNRKMKYCKVFKCDIEIRNYLIFFYRYRRNIMAVLYYHEKKKTFFDVSQKYKILRKIKVFKIFIIYLIGLKKQIVIYFVNKTYSF